MPLTRTDGARTKSPKARFADDSSALRELIAGVLARVVAQELDDP
jgi:hypothetical protein